MSNLSHAFHREEDLDALLASAEREKERRRLERVSVGKLRIPPETVEGMGKRAAENWTYLQPENILTKLQEQRRILQEEFRYDDPSEAPSARRRYRYRRNFARGAVKMIEEYLNQEGIHIPTQEEREQAAVARILEMEGALS